MGYFLTPLLKVVEKARSKAGLPVTLDALMCSSHAISILMKDHDTVKELFERFEKSESAAEKEKIIAQALTELKIHAAIEEEVFYPAVRKQVGKDLMNEADEEHHVARVLIAELERDGRGDDHRDAKFTVLAEGVKHHIKEEEGEMLPKAKGVEMDFEALGQKMLDRKKELKQDGIQPDAEHAMVAAAKGKGDSPAEAARRTKSGRSPERVTPGAKPKLAKPSSPRLSRRPSKGRRTTQK
jgi:hemerythrin-like domain-containing protein